MHPAYIRAEIEVKGSNLTEIARNAGLPDCTCRIALLFDYAPRGDVAIANFLNKPLHELWPHRYDRNNVRKVGRPIRADSTKTVLLGHCQKGAVA